MTLRSAIDDYKRNRSERTRFPGERRTTAGHFSGVGERLVHVGRDGSLADFSYPLSSLYGIDRSRFGVRVGGDVVWFDDCEPTDQRYVGSTALVETRYETDRFALDRYDLTDGRTHATHVVARAGEVDALVAVVAFSPGGRDDRIGQLVFEEEGVVEVYHREEHDFLASATGFDAVAGRIPERLPDVLADDPVPFPTDDDAGTYEAADLSGRVSAVLPLEAGSATLVTELESEPDREAAVASVAESARELTDRETLRAVATDQRVRDHDRATVVDDLRVLSLLSAPRGSRIAGPDFDPYYEYSGGYGYTWFRDDAEIARFLLESDELLGLDPEPGLEGMHDRSAAVYGAAQRADGTWPHRVWPDDGTIAPGWAHDRLEDPGVDYQADQSASVLSFLAAYAETGDEDDRRERVEPVVARGLDGLEATIADDGLPIVCQNAWENMTGRFAHTAATFLHAASAVANAPFSSDLRDRSADLADAVYRAVDELWVDERGVYALRLREDGTVDDRLDSSTLALVDAHRAYDRVGEVDADRRERLASHLETTLDGLYRETGSARGLIRFEGDDWRTREQSAEKIWTVSTAWGANAAAAFGSFADDEAYYGRARDLLAELLPGGSLCLESGYLPEQVFDDGTPDSATPLGWPHALRLATVAHLSAVDELGSLEEATRVGERGIVAGGSEDRDRDRD